MNAFLALASGVLVLVGVALVWPLWTAALGFKTKLWATGCVVTLVVGLSLGLYLKTSHYAWEQTDRAAVSPEIKAMVERLEQKLQSHPDDVTGWLLLGRSRMALAQYAKAQRAFERADAAAQHHNADALVGLSVALLLQAGDGAAFPEPAAEALESALALNPTQPDALYYGGVSDREHGRLERARQRWLTLLAQQPSDDIKNLVVDNIRSVDLARSQTADPQLDHLLAKLNSAAPATAATPAGQPWTLTVTVHVDPALHWPEHQGYVLVSAKPTDAPGPPWWARKVAVTGAVIRVELSDADAIMGSHDLRSIDHLVVTARLSRSGDALAQRGDAKGQVTVPVPVAPVDLVIHETVP